MTDIEKLGKLLTEFGVGFELITFGDEAGQLIGCHEGDAKISGHVMFFTTFEFDADGKFIEMGAWE